MTTLEKLLGVGFFSILTSLLGCYHQVILPVSSRELGLLLVVQLVASTFKKLLGCNHSCICHLFSVRWSLYTSWCSGSCWDWHISLLTNSARYLICCPKLLFTHSPLQRSHVLAIFSIVNFFDGLFCWIGVCHTLSKGSFRHYSSMSTILCWSKWGAWLLACPTTLTFRLFLVHFLTTFCTYLSLAHLIVKHLSHC